MTRIDFGRRFLVAFTRHEAVFLALDNRFPHGTDQLVNVRLFVSECQQARTVVPDVHASASQASEKDFAVNQFLMKLNLEQRTKVRQKHWCIHLFKDAIQFICQVLADLVQPVVHRLTAGFQMFQNRLRCRQRKWVTHERSCEVGHARFRTTIITKLPEASIKPVHVLGLTSNHSDWHASANDLAVRRKVRFDTKILLSTPQTDSQTSDNFIEDQTGWLVLRQTTQFLQKLFWLKLRHPALNRLD